MMTEIHDMAQEEITRAGRYIQELARVYGEFSPRCASTAVSWSRALGEAFDLAKGKGGSLSRDGNLSLYGVTGYGMHFGVIYRPDSRFRDVMTGTLRALVCISHGLPATDMESKECNADDRTEHVDYACYVADAPVSGEWSIHS
jgi:hypothetical protein